MIRLYFIFVLVMLLTCCCTPRRMDQWADAPIPVPDPSYDLVIELKPAHPFLDEMQRKVRVSQGGVASQAAVHMNTGGCDPIAIFWYPADGNNGPFVRLQDRCFETLIDLNVGRSYSLLRVGDDLYAGDFTETDGFSHSWSRSAMSDDPLRICFIKDRKQRTDPRELMERMQELRPDECLEGEPAIRISHAVSRGPGELLGCLDEEEVPLVLGPCAHGIPQPFEPEF